MILSGKEIQNQLDKSIVIAPFNQAQLGPNSYNLRLHSELMVYNSAVLDMKKKHETSPIIIPEEGLLLEPHRLYLGRTVEYTATESYVPMLEGRSSIGRLGLFIHITAGFGDVGFKGFWTLEIFCVQPIRIYPNVEICQIFYHTIEGAYEKYGEGIYKNKSGKYQSNTSVQASMLYKDFDLG
jgi:dCTP deaminase